MKKTKALKTRLTQKLLLISLIYLVGLILVMTVGYRVGKFWCSRYIWHGTERLYPILHWLGRNGLPIGMVLFFIGETGILFFFWRQAVGYLEEVSAEVAQLPQENDSWISLSPDIRELELALNQAHTQIRDSRRQAREAEQRKNDLVVYLAHDLKTPLTSVIGYLTLLEEAPELTAEQRAKYLSLTLNKANRLEELINEFFEITRFNLTSIELEKRSINFTLLLRQTVFEFEPMFSAKGLSCTLAAKQDYMLSCDLDKMQRVVDNLLRNAVLYADENSRILLELYETGEQLVLTCTDHGVTIPPEKLERIFEQFYRLDTARSTATGGSGLGLAIAREIVRLHGGRIFAESRDGTTTFTVELPRN